MCVPQGNDIVVKVGFVISYPQISKGNLQLLSPHPQGII